MKPYFKRGYSRNLLRWKELSVLINIRPLMSSGSIDPKHNRVRINGSEERFKWSNSSWSIDPNCFPSSLLKELMERYVCSFVDMSRSTKKINDFAKKLEEEYNLSADAHIYTCRNPKLGHPFGIHYDYADNVIVQCEGRTNFKVWAEVKPDYEGEGVANVNLTINDPPLIDVDMKPGDVIWIPKYYPHLASSKTSRMSVSFPLKYGPTQPREWVKL